MKWLDMFINSTSGKIVLLILAVDTIRAVLAYTGWVPRRKKFWGRLVYGKYDEDIMAQALHQLGYPARMSQREHKKLKAHIAKMKGTTSVTKENAPVYLILLLAKYCAYFQENVSYGGSTMSESRYYLNTMEIVHNENDLKTMCDVMVMLLNSVESKKPDVIIAPKGGNPMFAARVADYLDRPVIFAKGEGEKSKVRSASLKEQYQINYEGSWGLRDFEQKQTCAIIDCNLSGGSQLKAIVRDLNRLQSEVTGLAKVKKVFVLFRVDDRHKNVESTFSDLGVSLHRYFDLNEEIKEKIYQIKRNAEYSNREINAEYKEDWEKAEKIVEELKAAGKFYYGRKVRRVRAVRRVKAGKYR